jgi:hypothetical protein
MKRVNLRFHEWQGISSFPEQLLASQAALYSVKLFRFSVLAFHSLVITDIYRTYRVLQC